MKGNSTHLLQWKTCSSTVVKDSSTQLWKTVTHHYYFERQWHVATAVKGSTTLYAKKNPHQNQLVPVLWRWLSDEPPTLTAISSVEFSWVSEVRSPLCSFCSCEEMGFLAATHSGCLFLLVSAISYVALPHMGAHLCWIVWLFMLHHHTVGANLCWGDRLYCITTVNTYLC